MDIENLPNPASKFAKVMGCTCSEFKNDFGKGRLNDEGNREFVIDAECPLHCLIFMQGMMKGEYDDE